MSNAILDATLTLLHKLVGDIFDQLDGIPEDDLNSWLPRDGMRDVNTFFALATHTVGAGEFWILEAAGGRPVDRNRTLEFSATGSLRGLKQRYDRWLAESAEVFDGLDEAALASIYHRDASPDRGMSETTRTRAECIAHALEHTAVHVGHLQLQRQLWDAEQRGKNESV
jgi:hypothetical protein